MYPNRFLPIAAHCFPTLLFVSVFVGLASAQQAQIYPFYYNATGSNPQGGLVADKAGNLYGTTYSGGALLCNDNTVGCGLIFEFSPPYQPGGSWKETTLYQFRGSPDGYHPSGDLVLDSAGNLYGTTQLGGLGGGTVFELSPPSQEGGEWTETVLYAFNGPNGDGEAPVAGLIFDAAGDLYGTTSNGGTVFKLSPPSVPRGVWTETILHAFTAFTLEDGYDVEAPVIFDPEGNLYGTTSAGGAAGDGTVFELAPPSQPGGAWTETILYNFSPGTGSEPLAGLTFTSSGAILGTAFAGGPNTGGVVFALSAPDPGGVRHYSILYAFGGGAAPCSGLTLAGRTIYGTTREGGTFNKGTVFQLTQPSGPRGDWVETGIYSFSGGSDGGGPIAGVLLRGGALYGTAPNGGHKNNGVAFQLRP